MKMMHGGDASSPCLPMRYSTAMHGRATLTGASSADGGGGGIGHDALSCNDVAVTVALADGGTDGIGRGALSSVGVAVTAIGGALALGGLGARSASADGRAVDGRSSAASLLRARK